MLKKITLLLLFFLTKYVLLHAQIPIDVQKNYSESGVFEYETIEVEDNTTQILDSLQQLEQEAIWNEWHNDNKDKYPVPAGVTRLSCASDSLALLELYTATGGTNWTNTWDLAQPISTWSGVTVDATTGCVTRLYLYNNNLIGVLPDAIGDLAALNSLYLPSNEISGSLPSTIAGLTNLTSLSIWSNELSGEIPTWLGSMSNLSILDLSGNQFTGSIPQELSNLSNLEGLHLNNNDLDGNLPSWLGSMTSLTSLGLIENQFTGDIPTWLGNLTNLRYLGIGDSNFTGGLPSELANLTNLDNLDISGLGITSIPTWIYQMTNLKHLNLSENNLTGFIPTDFGNLVNLVTLYLSNNQLTGTIPNSFSSLVNLERLSIASNQLTGTIPTFLGTMTNLKSISLNRNLLDEIPDFTGGFTNLEYLDVDRNNLTYEDLLPNSEFFTSIYNYTPQNNFGTSTSITLNEGDSHTISFPIDPNITNSTYRWYKNNTLISTTTTPSLVLTNVNLNNAGIYHCEVINPDLPDLTLESNEIAINLILPSVPPNDMCANAIVLPVGNFSCTNPTTGFNIGATDSDNDSPQPPSWNFNSYGIEDVWYQFTVPNSGIFGFDLKKGTPDNYNACIKMYTGTCGDLTEVWGTCLGGGNWNHDYSTNIHNTAPAGTTIYLRMVYADTNGDPGIFDVCVYERPCKEASIGWDEVFACDNETEYYAQLSLYDIGDASSLTIFNDGGPSSISNITTTGFHSIGPLTVGTYTNITVQHNQNSVCNTSINLNGPYTGGTLVSNDEPCTATDINAYYGSTYSFTEGNNTSTARICEPSVPIGSCRTEGEWNDPFYRESIWFSFAAPSSGSLSLEMTNTASVAVWSATDCNALLNGTPTLEYAQSPCYGSPFTHTLLCLNPGEVYYLQVVNAYRDFDISMEEVTVPCGPLLNDQCVGAIAIPVESGVCNNAMVYTNIGATDSNNDTPTPPNVSTYGTDVWFSSIVPASGNLAMVFEKADDCYCRGVVTLYRGTCTNLVRIRNYYFNHHDDSELVYFTDLTPNDQVYYTVDFQNDDDVAGYFKMCVLDPPCLPVEWGYNAHVTCDDSEIFLADVNIYNVGTTSQFSIVDPVTNTSYYQNLTTTGTYQLGPFDRSAANYFQIIQDNNFCNSDDVYAYLPQSTAAPVNDNICNSINVSNVINNGMVSLTGSRSTHEECEPLVPVTNCDVDNGWKYSGVGGSTTWSYFEATSNNMALMVTPTSTNGWVKIALWEAATCTDLKDGNGVFIKAIAPCVNGNIAQLDFNSLDIGKRYYILVEGWTEYDLSLTSTPATCYVPDGLSVNNITNSSAILNWNAVAVATDYKLLYRFSNTNDAWIVADNVMPPLTIAGLAANASYEWGVQSLCENTSTGNSPYSPIDYFVTLNALSSCTGIDLTINGAIPDNTAESVAKTIQSAGQIDAGRTVSFTAGETITLNSGFHAKAGSNFTAIITPCSLTAIQAEIDTDTTNRTQTFTETKEQPIVEKTELQVTPNPLRNQANIRFYLPVTSAATIQISTSSGQLLTEEFISTTSGWNNTQLDASQLQGGLYYITLQTKQGRWTQKMMVLN